MIFLEMIREMFKDNKVNEKRLLKLRREMAEKNDRDGMDLFYVKMKGTL